MYGTIIEFNALADADRAGAKHQYLFGRMRFHGFILAAKAGIIIRGGCFKFSRTGIHHFKYRRNAVFITHSLNFFLRKPGQSGDDRIRKFHALCLPQQFRVKRLLLQGVFHFHNNRQLINEPVIYHRDIMYRIIVHAFSQCFSNYIDSLVIHFFHPIQQFFRRQR